MFKSILIKAWEAGCHAGINNNGGTEPLDEEVINVLLNDLALAIKYQVENEYSGLIRINADQEAEIEELRMRLMNADNNFETSLQAQLNINFGRVQAVNELLVGEVNYWRDFIRDLLIKRNM